MTKAIILAAGQGTRLRPVTDTVPKCMVPVHGKPIISWQINNLQANGITEVVIILGYKGEMVKEYVREAGSTGLKLMDNVDYKTTENIYSLYLARGELAGHAFLLMNGDLFCDPRIIELLLTSEKENLVPYDSTCFDEEELKIKIDKNAVSGILPKKTGKNDCDGATIGIFKIGSEASRHLFNELEELIDTKQEKKQWFEYALNNIFRRAKFHPLDVADYKWAEIDTIDDLERAKGFDFSGGGD
jgi:choline kinase